MQTETPFRPVPATDRVEIEGPSIQIAVSAGAVIVHDGTEGGTLILSSEFDSLRRALDTAEKIEAAGGAEQFPVKGGEQ